MRFWKYEAAGNDFVLVHHPGFQLDLEQLAQRTCSHHFGIGADGLLVLDKGQLRMFNPDGSEDFCGNGLRCAAVHAHEIGWLREHDVIHHFTRDVEVWITGHSSAKVNIGAGSFHPDAIPAITETEIFDYPVQLNGREWRISSLSTGSAHTIIDDQPFSDAEFFETGAALEHHLLFPERTSTMFVTTIAPRQLRMRPFERGVGETRACGTGSAAAAIVHSRKTGTTGTIEIFNTGGLVKVGLEHYESEVTLESEVRCVFSGAISSHVIQEIESRT